MPARRCTGASKAGRAHRRLASCSWGRCFCASKWWRTTSSSDSVMAGPISWDGINALLDIRGTADKWSAIYAVAAAEHGWQTRQAAPLLPHTPRIFIL